MPEGKPPPKCEHCGQKNKKDATVCQWCSRPLVKATE